MNKIILELLKYGFMLELSFNKESKMCEYRLNGFYKSSGITLWVGDGDNLVAIDRNKEVHFIDSFRELVLLNYQWWQSSKDRYEGWAVPEAEWLPFLLADGLVKEETNIVKTYK